MGQVLYIIGKKQEIENNRDEKWGVRTYEYGETERGGYERKEMRRERKTTMMFPKNKSRSLNFSSG